MLSALVNALTLTTLWIAFLLLAGLFGLNAGVETRIWFWYAVLGLFSSILCAFYSRRLVKWNLGIRVITPTTAINHKEKWLLTTVHALANAAGLKQPPEVGIYQSFEVNAFAIGPSKSKALVTVSQTFLDQTSTESAGALLAHEVAHIANGDMVTMTWLQSGINTMVLAPAHVIASLISNSANPRTRGAVYFLAFISLQIFMSPLASLLVLFVSRRREIRADLAAAKILSRERMRTGLMSLSPSYDEVDDSHQSVSAFKIAGHSAEGFGALFLTHPTLEERLRQIGNTD